MELNEISYRIIGSALTVHSELGPGLLESAYIECLRYELHISGLYVEKEKPIPLVYKEIKLEVGYRADLLVENNIIVEVKSVDTLHDIHTAQVLTYMRLAHTKLGLLINFNSFHLKDGIKRLIK
jgi:GxxExxY protein